MLREADARARSTLAGLLFLAVVPGGCGRDGSTETPAPTPGTTSSPPLAAYVLLTESPSGEAVPFARVIVDADAECPELTSSGTGETRTTTPRRNPHGFSVRVCEAVYPFGQSLRVAGSDIALPAVSRRVERVAVFGDTGCKPKDQNDCTGDDPASWPLKTFADTAAQNPPDLVLHMGDYNYRGTPGHFEGTVDGQPVEGQWVYDAGDGAEPSEKCEMPGPYLSENSSGSEDPDAWDDWRLDFFEPARKLLTAAPWIFARGNHELCSRAGPGWFYFLDPSSELPAGGGEQLACPPQDGGGPALPHLRFVEPYTVRLEGLDVSVLDSANACDELPNFTDTYRQQFAALELPDEATRWLMTHRPIWGVDAKADDAGFDCDGQPSTQPTPPYNVMNKTLQCALSGEVGAELLPEIDLLLAGHMHRFESITFAGNSERPPLWVIGNSGVELNDDKPDGAWEQVVDGQAAAGFALEQYAYLEMLRGASGTWRGQMVALDPTAWAAFLPACGTDDAPLCVKGL